MKRFDTQEVRNDIISEAQYGARVVIDGKTAWGGLGNRAGLHSYANDVIREKWEKSGARFIKKVAALKIGTVVEIQRFANITRDRGRWVTAKRYKIGINGCTAG